jgi:hypothetical protein
MARFVAGRVWMGMIPESLVRRWLEILLPLVSLGVLTVQFHPEYLPPALLEDPGGSILLLLARALLWAVLGIWALSALIVAFFLLYSPVYLLNRSAMLIGEGGWVDRREVRFYILCFALLCVLGALAYWQPPYALGLYILMAGFGPVMWRVMV